MPKRERQVIALANKSNTQSKKKQFIIFGLCSFLALLVCMATLVFTVKNLEKNNVVQTEDIYGGKTLLDNNKDDVCQYISLATNETQSNKFIKVNSYTDVYVDDDALLVDGKGDGNDKALAVYFKNKILSTVDGYYGEDYLGVFGTAYNKMPLLEISTEDLVDCNVTVGQADENGDPVYDDNGELVDKEYYFFTFTVTEVDSLNDNLKQAFGVDSKPNVKEMLKKDLEEYCTLSNMESEPQSYIIRAKVNILTDQLSFLEIERIYKFGCEAEFINEFSAFGKKDIELKYRVINKYEYFYAGISFVQDALTLEKGDEGTLNVNAVIEDDSEYTVKFVSSDKSVCTVDEMGYVTSLKNSDKPVTVTVELEYMGETFTDTCQVFVTSDNKEVQP